jgi:CrcB protein
MTVALVFLGAFLGAPLRYLTDRLVQSRHESVFPWGTFTVNVIGCVILGALTGASSALPGSILSLVGTGFCGALTTYSTFSYETLKLAGKRAYFVAIANVLGSIAVGLAAVVVARGVVTALMG